MDELKDKHARGVQERDDPDRAPTGEPYRQIQRQGMERARQEQTRKEEERQVQIMRIQELKEQVQRQVNKEENGDDEDDSDDEWLNELESDPTLEAIREQRLEQMRREHLQKLENRAKGHGEYRTISQDEFLPECTSSSEWVVVHFFHEDFLKCKVMDHHLKLVAEQHIECKFLRIDAQKAPFFCAKLKVKTLPTVLVLQEGNVVDRLLGFEGISEGNEWPTSLLQKWICAAGAIQYTPPSRELQEEMKRLGISVKGSIRKGGIRDYDEDDE